MRPLKITLEGFSAYRKKVEVDLEGVEYFSLSGPTGSGKSSLIDAMVFALYGRVPRLGGGTVAPIISTASEQARVSLDFAVGEECYTVARLVQRTKSGGANTTEARLEHGDQVVASGAGDVTEAVSELLRLSFEDFTRTVVLPQGEFARFLTAPPGERQQLLRGLLGLDVYGTVRALARSKESVAHSQAQDARSRLDALDLPDEEGRLVALKRSKEIDELAGSIPDEEEALARITAEATSYRGQLEHLETAKQRLLDLAAPPKLETLGEHIYEVRQELDALEDRRELLKKQRLEYEELLAELPSLEKLIRLQTTKDRLDDVEAKLRAGGSDGLESELESAEAEVARHGSSVDRLRHVLEEARVAHAAHDLASGLSVGDTCPVCNHIVGPDFEKPDVSTLDEARKSLEVGEAELQASRKRVSELSNRLGGAKTEQKALEEKRAELLTDLGGDIEELGSLDATRKSVEQMLEKLDSVTTSLHEIETPIKAKRREFEDLAEEQRSLGNRLMSRREALADLEPTPSESEDPIVQWKELLGWRDRKVTEVDSLTETLRIELASLVDDLEKARSSITAKLQRLEIPSDGQYTVAVVRAQEQALNLVERHKTLEEESEDLAKRVDQANHVGKVAGALSQHLKADGFERWLMVGAISNLVEGANALLAQLSDEGYSLAADANGSFDVIDHRNANESRPISTLSGGETFLVSLALALSLAETLSGSGGTGLDAIILDEGFGTLDDELLEVVASVLEDLAGRGLMVGIITHVKELAALASVRFRVSKEPDGSKVELVVA